MARILEFELKNQNKKNRCYKFAVAPPHGQDLVTQLSLVSSCSPLLKCGGVNLQQCVVLLFRLLKYCEVISSTRRCGRTSYFQCWYTTASFRPVKAHQNVRNFTTKYPNRPRFCTLYTKKYTVLKIKVHYCRQW